MALNLSQYDATALAGLLRDKQLSAVEVIEWTIQQIERLNPTLNAVIHRMDDIALARAKHWQALLNAGTAVPFAGVPLMLKDLLAEYEGTPFNEGSRACRGYVSKIDTELVRRYKAGGLVICGKTNTPEFGSSAATEPMLHGATKNPWDLTRIPGGSSGGSAAAVAAGIVSLGHANDGGGSIRVPASCCGLFGLKPTRGRNPLGPLFGDMGNGIIYEHAVTRSVRDSAALLDISAGPDVGDPYFAPPPARPFLEEVGRAPGKLKIGFLTSIPEGWHRKSALSPDCLTAVTEAARLCEQLGHEVEEIAPQRLAYPGVLDIFTVVFSSFIAHVVKYWEREFGRTLTADEIEPATWGWYQSVLSKSPGDYLQTIEDMQRFGRFIGRFFADGKYDCLLTPTMSIPPLPIGALSPSSTNHETWLDDIMSCACFTCIENLTGQPAMSIPLHWNAGNLPIGVQFAGRYGDEATLFRLAAQLEQARPWQQRIPLVHASKSSWT
jgi:amidase